VNSQRLEQAGRRFARFTARTVVARPWLWRVLRPLTRLQFERLAPVWDRRRGPESLIPLEAALEKIEPPRRVLDLGTGTGQGARALAKRFPEAEVVGVDLAPGMVEEARKLLEPELAGRVRYQAADASRLPFEDASFDLVVLLNMIPFFEELARVTAPGGSLVLAHSSGPETPIYTPSETLRARLEPLGFGQFEEIAAGEGTALLARRATQV
jgi:ubiquinone/menaquinone biosynthesis C-methylase UbiE